MYFVYSISISEKSVDDSVLINKRGFFVDFGWWLVILIPEFVIQLATRVCACSVCSVLVCLQVIEGSSYLGSGSIGWPSPSPSPPRLLVAAVSAIEKSLVTVDAGTRAARCCLGSFHNQQAVRQQVHPPTWHYLDHHFVWERSTPGCVHPSYRAALDYILTLILSGKDVCCAPLSSVLRFNRQYLLFLVSFYFVSKPIL